MGDFRFGDEIKSWKPSLTVLERSCLGRITKASCCPIFILFLSGFCILFCWFLHIILLIESEYKKPLCYCWDWDYFHASTIWVMLWFLYLYFIPSFQHLEVLFTFLFWTPFWDFDTLVLKFTDNSWSEASLVDPMICVYVLFLWLLFLLWFSSIPIDCPWCASSGAFQPRAALICYFKMKLPRLSSFFEKWDSQRCPQLVHINKGWFWELLIELLAKILQLIRAWTI